MSIKNFDINYGFNGEPSTATISFVHKKKECGNYEIHSRIGVFKGSARTGNQVIDEKIKDFVITEIKDSKEAGFKTATYELVDKQAKRLESIAVLVRGVTAPAIANSLNDFRRIFNSAELGINIGEQGATNIALYGKKIAVIGRTFSVVSASYQNESGSVFFSEGSEVARTPQGNFSAELLAALNENYKNASLRYGYYLSDFKELLEQLGYSVANFPSDDNFILLDFGGSLKEVVSSVASMFGMFWAVRGNVITFYDQSSIASLTVPNFNEYTDPNILSSNYSEDILGKSSVGVIVGTDTVDDTQNGQEREKGKTINFFSLDIDELFGQSSVWIKCFLSFFKFSKNTDFFNKIIFSLMRSDENNAKDMIASALYTTYYNETLVDKTKKTLEQVESDQTRRDDIKSKLKHLEKYTSFYSLKTETGFVQEPMKSRLLGIVQPACEAMASIYISKPVSSYTANNYTVSSSEGLSISPAYRGDTKVTDVPELQSISAIISKTSEGEDKTVAQLYRLANSQGTNGTSVLNPEDSYHYVGIADFYVAEGVKFKEAQDAVIAACEDGSGDFLGYNGNWFCTSDSEGGKFTTMFTKSTALYEELKSNVKEQIKVSAIEIEDEEDASEDPDLSIYASEFKSFSVRSSGSELSAVDIVTMEGTNSETQYLAANFSRLVGPEFHAISSAVTYSGLNIPSDSPILSSVSVTFTGGSVETALSYSNKEFLAESESLVMAGYSVTSSSRFGRKLNPRQKNFLGVN